MKVTFKDVLDRSYTTLFTDYKLDNLFEKNESAFYSFLSGFLINSIDKFDGCLGNLSYHEEKILNQDTLVEEVINVFDDELSSNEVRILALGVSIGWYRKQLDDVTQFRLHLSDKNFKTFSEQQNLQRRQDRLILMEEEFSEAMQSYQLSHFDKLPFFGEG